MGLFYAIMGISFFVLLIINIVLIGLILSFWITNGLQTLLQGKGFIESIYFSIYLKWVILADIAWIIAAISFGLKRKHYKTDPEKYYLKYDPIKESKICVILPAFNEELSIGKVVDDFIKQEYVKMVLVIDNHSSDNTADEAERRGAKVIRKERNTGWSHSAYQGLKEALDTDCNIIALAESDGTCNAYDIMKMLPYLDNCDFVVGSRILQVLSQKGNQLKTKDIWGNFILAKLIQLKFFSLVHIGVVSLTDVGSIFKMIRREALEKIIDKFTYPGTDRVKPGLEFNLFMIIESLKNDQRVIEVPISFNSRIGISKVGTHKTLFAIKVGFQFLWYILIS